MTERCGKVLGGKIEVKRPGGQESENAIPFSSSLWPALT